MTDAQQTSDAGEATTDRAVVAGQIGRTPLAMAGVGARCVYGYPAVTHQAPVDERGQPFPTAFYLTCPHLVKQIDRIESAGGVVRFEGYVAEDDELAASLDTSNARHAEIDDRGAAIAANTDPRRLKCLHAHAAFELAAGDHPLGTRVLQEAAPRWCDDGRCAAFVHEPGN